VITQIKEAMMKSRARITREIREQAERKKVERDPYAESEERWTEIGTSGVRMLHINDWNVKLCEILRTGKISHRQEVKE
jgi:hypothetical protein